jgi:hypothetical protein
MIQSLLHVNNNIHDRYKVFSFVFIEGSITGVPPASINQFLKRKFKLAFSFAGADARNDVKYIAEKLNNYEQLKDHIFYDNWNKQFLSAPGIDIILKDIYRKAELVIVFLSKNYSERHWCHIEWETLKKRLYSKDLKTKMSLMLIKQGTFNAEELCIEPTDGYVDAEEEGNESLIELIAQRYQLITQM